MVVFWLNWGGIIDKMMKNIYIERGYGRIE